MAMISSPDFDNEIENCNPDSNSKMVADKLSHGGNFTEWMSKEKFSNGDPLLILDYVGIDFHNRVLVKNAL
uniref:Uncharacterized protein n=1 Tax=Meloidogyne javanica TaxID=6303 RepID=A0A915MIX4_MELJA